MYKTYILGKIQIKTDTPKTNSGLVAILSIDNTFFYGIGANERIYRLMVSNYPPVDARNTRRATSAQPAF